MRNRLAILATAVGLVLLGAWVLLAGSPREAALGPRGPNAVQESPTGEGELTAVQSAPRSVRKEVDPSLEQAEKRPVADRDPEPATSVFGRVEDTSGQPIEHFRLDVKRVRSSGFDLVAQRVVDDPQGRFEESGLPPGRYRIEVHSELISQPARVDVAIPHEEELVLVLARPGRVLGRVVDPYGLAVAGAHIRSSQPGPGQGTGLATQTESDAEGRFELPVATGRSSLFATATGFAPSPVRQVRVPLEETVEVELVLTAEAAIHGVVLREDGSPEPGADVHLASFTKPGSGGIQRESDAGGRFEFGELAAGSYLVLVDEGGGPEGERGLRAEQVTLQAGETVEVVLGGQRPATIELALEVRFNGTPAAGGTAIVFPEGPEFLADVREAELDGAGRATVELARAGRHQVRVRYDREQGQGASERGELTRTVDIPEVPRHELSLDFGGCSVSGRVVDLTGGPSQFANLDLFVLALREDHWDPTSLFPWSGGGGLVGAEGHFEIEGLEPGRYTLEVAGAAPVRGIVLRPGEHRGGFELATELGRGGTIVGRVLGADDQPLQGARVYVRARDGGFSHRYGAPRQSREGDGRFAFDLVRPGEYTLHARLGELASRESEPLAVTDTGEPSEVTLRLAPGAMVRIALVDDGGQPVPEAVFRAIDELGRGHHEPRTPHDLELFLREGFRTGARTLGPLAPGTWRLEGLAPDGRRAVVTRALDAGWSGVTLSLD